METSAHEGMNVHRVSARFNALSLIGVLVSLIPSSQVFLRLAEMLLQDHDIFMPGAEVWFCVKKVCTLTISAVCDNRPQHIVGEGAYNFSIPRV